MRLRTVSKSSGPGCDRAAPAIAIKASGVVSRAHHFQTDACMKGSLQVSDYRLTFSSIAHLVPRGCGRIKFLVLERERSTKNARALPAYRISDRGLCLSVGGHHSIVACVNFGFAAYNRTGFLCPCLFAFDLDDSF